MHFARIRNLAIALACMLCLAIPAVALAEEAPSLGASDEAETDGIVFLSEADVPAREGVGDNGAAVELLAEQGSRVEPITRANPKKLRIALDPGHGGWDPGACANGMEEAQLTLKIAKYLKAELEKYADVEVFLTRTEDEYVYLTQRTRSAYNWGADVFISLHINASGNSGALVIVPNDSTYQLENRTISRDLANSILTQLNTQTGLPNLGFLKRNCTTGDVYPDGYAQDYHTVINTSRWYGMPGILVEHGFIDGSSLDVGLLSSDAGLRKLAKADADGIARYYGLNKVANPSVWVSALSNGQVTVKWTPVEGATAYTLFHNYVYDDIGEEVSGIWLDADTTEYTFTDHVPGRQITFFVAAHSGDDMSSLKNAARVTVTSLPSPTILSAEETDGGVSLAWEAVEGADSYVVTERRSNGTNRVLATVEATSCEVSDLLNGREHKIYVQARTGNTVSPLAYTFYVLAYPEGDTLPSAAGRFLDVPDADWPNKEVTLAYHAGYMTGYGGSDYFGTNKNLTRAEAICVLYKMSGGSIPKLPIDVTYVDTNPGAFYDEALAWASSLGIAQGSDGAYRPNDPVTREEWAALLSRYALLCDALDQGMPIEDALREVLDVDFPGVVVQEATDEADTPVDVAAGEDGELAEEAGETDETSGATEGTIFDDSVADSAAIDDSGVDVDDADDADAAAAAAREQAIEQALSQVSDPQTVSQWAREYVAWAIDAGIMGTNGKVAGKSNVTRAEAAAMAVRTQPATR